MYLHSEYRTSRWIKENSSVCEITGYPIEKVTKDKLYQSALELYKIKDILKRYLTKISGPLLDRIDLHVEVTPVSYDELSAYARPLESSEAIRERVVRARAIQAERFRDVPSLYCNAQMPSRMVQDVCQIDQAGLTLLKTAMQRLQLSAPTYDRILKVARTAADLAASENIRVEHLVEAINYRSLDREGWAG